MLDMEGHGHEDDGDHMHRFFQGGKNAAPIQMNKRNILADIEMGDDGLYEAKKVSRAQLMKENIQSEDQADEEGGSDDEQGESDLEGMESAEMEMEEEES